MANLTGQDIINFFKRLVGDESISDDLALDLANTAKDEIEEERGWRMLLVKDTSKTFGPGDDYTTAKDLPDDFRVEHKVALVDSEGNEVEYEPIPFENLVKNKDSDYYSIDYANNKLYISGSVSKTYTIYLYYFKFTDDLTLTTSPTWPSRFHKIIPYKMAEIWLAGIDADTLTRLQWTVHKEVGDRLYKAMKRWDATLWSRSMGDRTIFPKETRDLRTNVIEELAD